MTHRTPKFANKRTIQLGQFEYRLDHATGSLVLRDDLREWIEDNAIGGWKATYHREPDCTHGPTKSTRGWRSGDGFLFPVVQFENDRDAILFRMFCR